VEGQQGCAKALAGAATFGSADAFSVDITYPFTANAVTFSFSTAVARVFEAIEDRRH